MLWGDFPDTNAYMVAWINSILLWIMFKIVVYLIVMLFFRHMSKYSKYSENILTSITVVYGVVLLNNLASVTMQIPVFDISPDFYSSIEANHIEIIP